MAQRITAIINSSKPAIRTLKYILQRVEFPKGVNLKAFREYMPSTFINFNVHIRNSHYYNQSKVSNY